MKHMLKILGQIHLFLFVVLEIERMWGLELLTPACCQVKPETEAIPVGERERNGQKLIPILSLSPESSHTSSWIIQGLLDLGGSVYPFCLNRSGLSFLSLAF